MATGARGAGGQGPITLDQLIALNDEIVALARSGMPLERGLLESSRDLPGRLGRITKALGDRMSQGEDLTTALAALGDSVPPVYGSVVEAGIRSGQLGTALEGMASYARGYADARRSIGLALWYPMLVFVLAYAVFIFLIYFIFPKFEAILHDFGVPVHPAFALLARVGHFVVLWWWIVPLLLVGVLAWWVGSGRAAGLGRGGRRASGLLQWFPWFGRMLRAYEAAGFADLLALLLEQGVPYPKALRLSGQASGDANLAVASDAIARAFEEGASPAEATRATALPPMLRWVLASGGAQGGLVPALRQMGQRYRTEARDQAEKLRVLLPTALLFVIGASATLVYALAVFYPVASLWQGLALPTN